VRSAAVSDDPLAWRIAAVRGQLLELGSAVRQLNKSGLDSAAAQLLLVRKRAELEDLMKLAKRNRDDLMEYFFCQRSQRDS
jgi:hypothetical protein